MWYIQGNWISNTAAHRGAIQASCYPMTSKTNCTTMVFKKCCITTRTIVSTSFLIQRLVLFFYPMAAQKPLWQRVFRHFLEKVSRDNHHSDHVNRRGRQNRFLRQFFLPHCQLLSIDGSFTNFYQRCSLWESLTYIYGCRRPYIYWIFRGFYGIVKP